MFSRFYVDFEASILFSLWELSVNFEIREMEFRQLLIVLIF